MIDIPDHQLLTVRDWLLNSEGHKDIEDIAHKKGYVVGMDLCRSPKSINYRAMVHLNILKRSDDRCYEIAFQFVEDPVGYPSATLTGQICLLPDARDTNGPT